MFQFWHSSTVLGTLKCGLTICEWRNKKKECKYLCKDTRYRHNGLSDFVIVAKERSKIERKMRVDDVAGFAWVEDIFGWKRKEKKKKMGWRRKKKEGRKNRVGMREWVNKVKVSLKKYVVILLDGYRYFSHFNNGNYSKDWIL